MFEDDTRKWETELHARTAELLAERLAPLQTEVERLQTTLTELSAQLLEKTRTVATTEETAGITAQVRDLLQDQLTQAEQAFQQKLQAEVEQARVQAVAETRQEFEAEMQTRLDLSHQAGQREAAGEIEQLRTQLASLASGAAVTPSAAPTTTASHNLLKTAIEEIDAQRTQSETLTALLKHAAAFSPRVSFFVVKSGEAIGWKALGFENGLTDETARTLSVSIQANSLVGQALSSQHTAIALNPAQAEITPMLGRFSHPVPQGAVAVPLVVRGKAAAVLYADSGTQSDESIQLEAIELLIQVASMAIELLPVRRNAGDTGRAHTPAPVPSAPVAAPVEVPSAPQPEPPPPAEVPAPEPAPPASDFAPATYRNEESAPAAYTADPTTNRPFEAAPESIAEPAPQQWAALQQQEAPVATSEPAVDDYTPPPPFVQPVEVAPEPSPIPFQATPERIPERIEDEKPSIYDLLRMNAADAQTPGVNPGIPFGGYVAPEPPPPAPPLSGDLSNKGVAALPSWMQRLQEEEVEEPVIPAPPVPPASPWARLEESVTPPPPAPSASPWARLEENYPQAPPPAPPPPPPLRIPSLSETLNNISEVDEAETDRLPSPPLVQPFQPESPSVRFSFNQPSEPPRYAAPSLSVSNAATETEVRAHNDARRFARLLVSEIKLYNAAKVNEGRRLADLYDRLKDEIDRSRKVYDKRVSPAVAAKFDYFYDELVQTLAEGDPSKLGGNCPGPVVITT